MIETSKSFQRHSRCTYEYSDPSFQLVQSLGDSITTSIESISKTRMIEIVKWLLQSELKYDIRNSEYLSWLVLTEEYKKHFVDIIPIRSLIYKEREVNNKFDIHDEWSNGVLLSEVVAVFVLQSDRTRVKQVACFDEFGRQMAPRLLPLGCDLMVTSQAQILHNFRKVIDSLTPNTSQSSAFYSSTDFPLENVTFFDLKESHDARWKVLDIIYRWNYHKKCLQNPMFRHKFRLDRSTRRSISCPSRLSHCSRSAKNAKEEIIENSSQATLRPSGKKGLKVGSEINRKMSGSPSRKKSSSAEKYVVCATKNSKLTSNNKNIERDRRSRNHFDEVSQDWDSESENEMNRNNALLARKDAGPTKQDQQSHISLKNKDKSGSYQKDENHRENIKMPPSCLKKIEFKKQIPLNRDRNTARNMATQKKGSTSRDTEDPSIKSNRSIIKPGSEEIKTTVHASTIEKKSRRSLSVPRNFQRRVFFSEEVRSFSKNDQNVEDDIKEIAVQEEHQPKRLQQQSSLRTPTTATSKFLSQRERNVMCVDHDKQNPSSPVKSSQRLNGVRNSSPGFGCSSTSKLRSTVTAREKNELGGHSLPSEVDIVPCNTLSKQDSKCGIEAAVRSDSFPCRSLQSPGREGNRRRSPILSRGHRGWALWRPPSPDPRDIELASTSFLLQVTDQHRQSILKWSQEWGLPILAGEGGTVLDPFTSSGKNLNASAQASTTTGLIASSLDGEVLSVLQDRLRNGVFFAMLMGQFEPLLARSVSLSKVIFMRPTSLWQARQNLARALWLIQIRCCPPVPWEYVVQREEILKGNKDVVWGLLFYLSQVYPTPSSASVSGSASTSTNLAKPGCIPAPLGSHSWAESYTSSLGLTPSSHSDTLPPFSCRPFAFPRPSAASFALPRKNKGNQAPTLPYPPPMLPYDAYQRRQLDIKLVTWLTTSGYLRPLLGDLAPPPSLLTLEGPLRDGTLFCQLLYSLSHSSHPAESHTNLSIGSSPLAGCPVPLRWNSQPHSRSQCLANLDNFFQALRSLPSSQLSRRFLYFGVEEDVFRGHWDAILGILEDLHHYVDDFRRKKEEQSHIQENQPPLSYPYPHLSQPLSKFNDANNWDSRNPLTDFNRNYAVASDDSVHSSSLSSSLSSNASARKARSFAELEEGNGENVTKGPQINLQNELLFYQNLDYQGSDKSDICGVVSQNISDSEDNEEEEVSGTKNLNGKKEDNKDFDLLAAMQGRNEDSKEDRRKEWDMTSSVNDDSWNGRIQAQGQRWRGFGDLYPSSSVSESPEISTSLPSSQADSLDSKSSSHFSSERSVDSLEKCNTLSNYSNDSLHSSRIPFESDLDLVPKPSRFGGGSEYVGALLPMSSSQPNDETSIDRSLQASSYDPQFVPESIPSVMRGFHNIEGKLRVETTTLRNPVEVNRLGLNPSMLKKSPPNQKVVSNSPPFHLDPHYDSWESPLSSGKDGTSTPEDSPDSLGSQYGTPLETKVSTTAFNSTFKKGLGTNSVKKGLLGTSQNALSLSGKDLIHHRRQTQAYQVLEWLNILGLVIENPESFLQGSDHLSEWQNGVLLNRLVAKLEHLTSLPGLVVQPHSVAQKHQNIRSALRYLSENSIKGQRVLPISQVDRWLEAFSNGHGEAIIDCLNKLRIAFRGVLA